MKRRRSEESEEKEGKDVSPQVSLSRTSARGFRKIAQF